KLRDIIKAACETCMKTVNIASFINIFEKKVSKEEGFEKLLADFHKDLAPVEKAINDAYPMIDILISKAKQINSTRSQDTPTAVKILEEMDFAISVINDIYDHFQQGA